MNLKTLLFITLFLSAIVLSHQETADAENQNSLIKQARAAQKKVVADLKTQAKGAKAQFKAAYEKLRPAKAGESSDSSDSDNIIQQAITEATNVADQAKQNDWNAVRELKAQAQKAKQVLKDAKEKLKASRTESSSSSSDSSDISDSDVGVGVDDKVKRAAEWQLIATLKEQVNNAKEAARQAYKKLRNKQDSSSSSDEGDSTITETLKEKATETVEEVAKDAAGSVLDQAKQAQRTAYEQLKGEANKAKETFQNAYRDLKARIRSEKSGAAPEGAQAPAEESDSSSSSSSSSSSDSDDGIVARARRYSQKLLDQVRNRGNDEAEAPAPPKVDTEL